MKSSSLPSSRAITLSLEAVLYAVVHRAPEPLDRVRPGLPPSLVRIVNRALATRAVGT